MLNTGKDFQEGNKKICKNLCIHRTEVTFDREKGCRAEGKKMETNLLMNPSCLLLHYIYSFHKSGNDHKTILT